MKCSTNQLSTITSISTSCNTATKRINSAVKSAYQVTELLRQSQLLNAPLLKEIEILDSSLHRLTDLSDCDREGEIL